MIGFDTYFYFSHQLQFSLVLQAMITVNGKYNNDYVPYKTEMDRLEFIPKGYGMLSG